MVGALPVLQDRPASRTDRESELARRTRLVAPTVALVVKVRMFRPCVAQRPR